MRYVRDYNNGLHVKKELAGYLFDAQFKPWELMWIERGNPTSSERDQVRLEFSDLQYYALAIQKKDGGDIIYNDVDNSSQVQQNLYYYSYLFQNDIFLEDGDEKLPCILFHFENSTGMTTKRTFLLGFKSLNKNEKSTLVINSNKLSSLPIRIEISKENIPTLNL